MKWQQLHSFLPTSLRHGSLFVCFLQGGGHGWEARITILAPPFLPLPEVLHDHKAQFMSTPAGAASIIPSSQEKMKQVMVHSGEGRKSGQVPGRRGPSHIRAKYSRLGATCVNMEQIMNPLTGGYYARERLPATMDLEGTRPLELLPEQSVTSTLWEECPRVCIHVCTNKPKYCSETEAWML